MVRLRPMGDCLILVPQICALLSKVMGLGKPYFIVYLRYWSVKDVFSAVVSNSLILLRGDRNAQGWKPSIAYVHPAEVYQQQQTCREDEKENR